MVRRILLACTALACASAPATAQFTDAPARIQRTLHQGQTLLQWKRQIEDMGTRIQQARTQLEALTGERSLGGVGDRLAGEALRSPMAPSSEMPGLLDGRSEGGRAGRFRERNRVYDPVDEDYAAREIRRRGRAVANLQGEIHAGLEAAEERQEGLLELVAAVERQPDLPAAQALNSRIAAENVLLKNEQDKLARLNVLLRQEERNNQQRDAEESRRSADAYYEKTLGAWDAPW